ncbi:hypothetical protein HUE87_06575 [Candidatus Sulfurimonas marisnigri]|uniref:Outer membrane lipoprotein carrier protein LolA n=1 Tax=Candidatus Sulfurimonas marisnigri TaxID=2740405 RepID=A0A7S7LY89_9BACT|nr:hypothetical protein [Candidatus Sulfurimonas marisnigri]QOY53587.1 hypothetical protein HUE87_06575 [Candidatus Sulfurimonas marisnigri]
MTTIIKFFLAITIFSLTLSAKELSIDTVIQNMIKAYGGEKNLERSSSYEQVWQIDRQTDGVKGRDNRKVILPYYLRTKLIYPEKTEIRVVIRDNGTKEFSGRKVQAKGPMLDAMKLQLMRLFTPLILKNRLKDITMITEKNQYILSLKNNSITSKYFVSKNSFLVDKVIGELKIGSMNMEFLTIYEDYKSANGVMMPHREIKYAGSVNTAIMTLKETKPIQSPNI